MSFYKSVVHRKDSLKLIIWRFCLFLSVYLDLDMKTDSYHGSESETLKSIMRLLIFEAEIK